MYTLKEKDNISALIDSEALLLLQFGSGSCAPCAAIKNKIDKFSETHPALRAVYVPIEEVPRLAAQYDVFTVPCILLFAQGRMSIRQAGYFSLQELLQRVQRYYELLEL